MFIGDDIRWMGFRHPHVGIDQAPNDILAGATRSGLMKPSLVVP